MIVRPIEREDLLSAEYNRCICFKMPVDFDRRRAEIAAGTDSLKGRYGVFTDDGAMMSYLIDNPFSIYFDGSAVSCGGIGSVTTLPEYRASGSMRALLAHVLEKGREEGEVFSMLGPFSYPFYRKFGYEAAYSCCEYTVPVAQFAPFRHTGWVQRLRGGDEEDLSRLARLYNRFARPYNLAIARDESFFHRRFLNKPDEVFLNEHTFFYLLGEGEEAGAYLMFRFAPEAHEDTLMEIVDLAFDGVRGLRMLFGFLARMSADYHTVRLRLPGDVQLHQLLAVPPRLNVNSTRMARVVNVEEALRLAKKPAGLRAVLEVTDDLLPENAGRWLVEGNSVTRTELAPDLTVDIRALAPMLLGSLPLPSALYRQDVSLHGNEEALTALFPAKVLYQHDHF